MFGSLVEWIMRGGLSEEATPPRPANARASARPIVVNPTLGQQYSIAAYRIDAIRRAITQREEAGIPAEGRDAWRRRCREYFGETVQLTHMLQQVGALSETSVDEAVAFVLAAKERA